MTEREMKQRKAAARKARKERERKARNRRVVLTVCLMLAVCVGSIGGTIAWLQDSTDEVINTFSASDINIYMTETVNGTTDNTKDGPINNNGFKMVPGHTIQKDPKVVVEQGSEACYVFVKFTKSANFDNFMTYTVADEWTELTDVSGVYYRRVPATNDAAATFEVLADNQVQVKDTVTKEMMNALTTETQPTLTFQAYAIQQSNGIQEFTANAAWQTLITPSGSGIIAGN